MARDFEIIDGVLVKYLGWERTVIIPKEVTAIKEKAFYKKTVFLVMQSPNRFYYT